MARSPQPPSGRVQEALPLKLARRSVITTWVTHSKRLHSATSVLVKKTVWGSISGHWTQSSVLGLGMAQLTFR